jgi:hypothetical protein
MKLRLRSLFISAFLAYSPLSTLAMIENKEETPSYFSEEQIHELLTQEKYDDVIQKCDPKKFPTFIYKNITSGNFNYANALLQIKLSQREKELKIAQDNKDDESEKGVSKSINDIIYTLGDSARIQGDYENAIKYYTQMTEKTLLHYLAMGHSYTGLYLNSGDLNDSINAKNNYHEYNNEYDKLSQEEKQKNKKIYGYYLWGLSQINLKEDSINALEEDYENAENFFLEDATGTAYMKLIEAEYYIKHPSLCELSDILKSLSLALNHFDKTNDLEGLITGYFLASQTQYEKADEDYNTAMDLVNKHRFKQFERFYREQENIKE